MVNQRGQGRDHLILADPIRHYQASLNFFSSLNIFNAFGFDHLLNLPIHRRDHVFVDPLATQNSIHIKFYQLQPK